PASIRSQSQREKSVQGIRLAGEYRGERHGSSGCPRPAMKSARSLGVTETAGAWAVMPLGVAIRNVPPQAPQRRTFPSHPSGARPTWPQDGQVTVTAIGFPLQVTIAKLSHAAQAGAGS